MKTIILAIFMIFGLTATNHGRNVYISDGDEVKLSEENYVDDIPFDTHAIACSQLLGQMVKNTEEPVADDIPFDTRRICSEYKFQQLVEQYKSESEARDFPGETLRLTHIALYSLMQQVRFEFHRITARPANDILKYPSLTSFSF